jgi:hypothetical protein
MAGNAGVARAYRCGVGVGRGLPGVLVAVGAGLVGARVAAGVAVRRVAVAFVTGFLGVTLATTRKVASWGSSCQRPSGVW